ncbi:hypothetical protein GOL43_30730 [Sinorhizobium medicae]|nr:hypothetical protein [Sinorhizobium medicae]
MNVLIMFSTPKESIRLFAGLCINGLMARASSKKPRDLPPTDPMPARVDPCLATLVDRPPKGPEWAYEVKWDGYRLAVHIEPGRVRVLTRGGYDWTERFPMIADDARRLAMKTAILDGEAVVFDHQGRSDFGMLQRALGRLPSPYEAGAIVFYAFDLLYLDGRVCADCRWVSAGDCLSRSSPGERVQSASRKRCRQMAMSSSGSPARTVSKASSPSTSRSPIAPAAVNGGRRSPVSAATASWSLDSSRRTCPDTSAGCCWRRERMAISSMSAAAVPAGQTSFRESCESSLREW